MTVSVILAGLVPIMFSTGTGAGVMKRIAVPMVGKVVTSAILELLSATWKNQTASSALLQPENGSRKVNHVPFVYLFK